LTWRLRFSLCGSSWRFTGGRSRDHACADVIGCFGSACRGYAFLVLSHDRRRVLHFGVTAHPTSAWTAQQLTEAFPFERPPRFVLHDRGGIQNVCPIPASNTRAQSKTSPMDFSGTTLNAP